MFEKIVVAVDGSEQAWHALEVTCDLANKYGAKVHVVHSPELETTGISVGSGAVEIKQNAATMKAAGKKLIDTAIEKAEKLGCKPTTTVIGMNEPAEDILDEIKAKDADLVVMGRRGLGRISSLLLGSVSQKVSHDAKCACMTVC